MPSVVTQAQFQTKLISNFLSRAEHPRSWIRSRCDQAFTSCSLRKKSHKYLSPTVGKLFARVTTRAQSYLRFLVRRRPPVPLCGERPSTLERQAFIFEGAACEAAVRFPCSN